MKKSKEKRIKKPGALVAIKSTDCVFMSVGLVGKRQIDVFNGFNLRTGAPERNISGEARLATKAEQGRYWNILRNKLKLMNMV